MRLFGLSEEDRDVDLAFNSLLESNYNEDQIGDMEGEDIEQGQQGM